LKLLNFIYLGIFLFGCDDIGKDFSLDKDKPSGFSRFFGTVGYDYGWNAEHSILDQGIIIVGRQQKLINGQTDLWGIKTSAKGIVEWERIFGGDNNDEGLDVISTSDGGFLFVGYSWSFGKNQQVYAIKTDFYGNIIWENNYGGTMWDVGEAVIELQNGGFLIAGHSNSPGISTGNTDIFLIKINNDGNVVWQNGYGNLQFPNHEWAYDLKQLTNGDVLVVGARDRYQNGSKNGLIIRVDNKGNLMWEKELLDDETIDEIIYSIDISENGKYFICSTTNSHITPKQYHPKITKIDVQGNIDWSRKFLANGKRYHQFRATNTSVGDIVIAGSSVRDATRGNDEDAFMTRIDSNGNIIWTKAYGSADNDDWGWSVFETNNKDLILIGSTKSFGASLFDVYLVGTNSKGILW
tara:strand:- start:58 stop:1284 length:1227 start_codon:yes stop_codon:yes gene_type:complete